MKLSEQFDPVTFKIVGNRVIIKLDVKDNVRGVYLPDSMTTGRGCNTGVIVNCNENDDFKIGDRVCFPGKAGQYLDTFDGRRYLEIYGDDILAVLQDAEVVHA